MNDLSQLQFLNFFGMKNPPFTQSVPVNQLYKSPMVNDALERLAYAVDNNLFAVLSGPVDCGKSTLLRTLSSSLEPDRFRCLYISESNLTPRWLYSVPLRQLGIEPKFYANDVKRQLHDALMCEARVKHKKIVMIIDEAHLIDDHHCRDTLEEIRFLLNCDYDSGNPLALILCGQNELWELLNKESAEAIAQRIDVIASLGPMDLHDLSGYIDAHLRYAGAYDDIFSAQAVEAIAKASGGIARIVNKICLHALLAAAAAQTKVINAELIQHVVATELPKTVIR